jgi:Putative zinc-finger
MHVGFGFSGEEGVMGPSLLVWLFLLPFGAFAVLFGLYWVGCFLAWRRECRWRQAMRAFRLLPEERKRAKAVVRVIPLLGPTTQDATSRAEPLPKLRCRYGECATLYLSGDLPSWRRMWFDTHCADCDSCWERFTQEKRLRAPDERCVWGQDIGPYVDRKLSSVDRERFKGHLIICEDCAGAVETVEEQFEDWLAEWEPIFELEYRPRSQGESSA